MGSVVAESTDIHAVSTARLTLDELEDYERLTAVLKTYRFLHKDDMELLEAMVRRHECLRVLAPYVVSSDAEKQAFATMNIGLMRAALEIVDVYEYMEAHLDD